MTETSQDIRNRLELPFVECEHRFISRSHSVIFTVIILYLRLHRTNRLQLALTFSKNDRTLSLVAYIFQNLVAFFSSALRVTRDLATSMLFSSKSTLIYGKAYRSQTLLNLRCKLDHWNQSYAVGVRVPKMDIRCVEWTNLVRVHPVVSVVLNRWVDI